jgi:hypothetical protein
MKEWPRLIQERVNCSNALGKRLRINDFRCHNAKRKEHQRRGEDCVTCIVRQKPVACLTRDSNPQLVLRQSIQTPMKCHRHTRWNQDAIYRFHIACYRVADVGGRKATSLWRWWDYEISGVLGYDGSIWRLRSEGRRFACVTNHVPSDRTASCLHSSNTMHVKSQYPGTRFWRGDWCST